MEPIKESIFILFLMKRYKGLELRSLTVVAVFSNKRIKRKESVQIYVIEFLWQIPVQWLLLGPSPPQ